MELEGASLEALLGGREAVSSAPPPGLGPALRVSAPGPASRGASLWLALECYRHLLGQEPGATPAASLRGPAARRVAEQVLARLRAQPSPGLAADRALGGSAAAGPGEPAGPPKDPWAGSTIH